MQLGPEEVCFLLHTYACIFLASQTSSVEALTSTHRFGYTRDIASLYEDDGDANDYMMGLAWLAGITGACFLSFIIVIIIFKCCGKRRVGFLSGARFEVNSDYENGSSSTSYEYSDGDKRNGFRRCCCSGTVASVRFTFILSGCIFIAFAMLMVTKGVTNLQDSVKSVHHSAANIEYIATEAQDILQNGFREIQGVATQVRSALEAELNLPEFCPDDPEFGNNTQAAQVVDQTQDAVVQLRKIDTLVSNRVDEIAQALGEVSGESQTVVDEIGDVDLTDWEALLILIVFTMVPGLLVCAAILAHFDIETSVFHNVVDCFLLPLFFFMVLLCVVVSCAMLATAAINSDFCLPGGRPEDSYPGDSPDYSVKRFLDSQGYVGEEDYVRTIADWYIGQCRKEDMEDPFEFLTAHLPDLVRTRWITGGFGTVQ